MSMKITQIADIRAETKTIHETLDAFKQESQGLAAALDAELADAEGERAELLEETKTLAQAVFLRIHHGDESFAAEEPEDTVESDE